MTIYPPLKLTQNSQSALTDFLASHNISARQITEDFQRRLQEAQDQQEQSNTAETQGNQDDDDDDDDEGEDPAERKKRKRKEEMAIMKIKQSKEFKRRKYEKKKGAKDDDDYDDDVLARSMLAKAQPLPGQLDNCEICEKRFTVTPYSKTGPDGGLLCTKCSKELKDEEKRDKAQVRKKAAPKLRKRQTESDRLMGEVKPGSKSLAEICVRRVADVVHDIDEFGDMPQTLLKRLSQILSKKRVLTSRTLDLFLRPDFDRIDIYDCGKLEQEDFQKIFAFMPDVETVNLRFSGQIKDDALMYMIEKSSKIKHLQLGASNLVSDKAWTELFRQRGDRLETLKLSELNDSLNDDTVAEMVKHCVNLRRLKLRSCSHMGPASIDYLSNLGKLEHLTLAVAQDTPAQSLVNLIINLGRNLKTLSLENYIEADDTVLEAILNHCSKLTKLRLTGNSNFTDRAFASLFGLTSTNPPILFADFSENRDIEASDPDGPQQEPVGFGGEAFKALMHHSGQYLERLDLHSDRHISHEALLEVFDGVRQYPSLKDIDMSFVTHLDDVVMTGIFKSCPALSKLAVFACFNATSARIPAGIAVIGLPNAQDNIVIEGDVVGEL